MSLFKAREWWSTTSGFEEFHDLGSLCVANIESSSQPCDKIVVGSYQGLIRVYSPQSGAFSPDHLLLEQQMGGPVLQVVAGKFIQNSKETHLAILQPRELGVYYLTSSPSSSSAPPSSSSSTSPSTTDQYQLNQAYKHTLHRTACNMTFGPFGNARDQDHICVQSMDGQLSFFSQGSFAFSIFLPDFLSPGPLCYLARTDCIVTGNSARQLQCFKYQSLSVASTSSGEGESRDNVGKRVVTEWTVNLGDHVISIRTPDPLPGQPSQLLVLGERAVYGLKDTGQLRFMKKLEVNPSCAHPYRLVTGREDDDGGAELQYLLASHSGQLFVFRDSTLVWSATLDHPPADITVASFPGLQGVVVTLDELGHLACCYLGTDPSMFAAPVSGTREINYEEMEKEMRDLKRAIKQAEKGGGDSGVSSLIIKSEVVGTPRVVELPDMSEGEGVSGEGVKEEGVQKCVEVKLHLSSTGTSLSDVTTTITSTLPLTTHPSHLHHDTISPIPTTHMVTVVCTPHLLPSQRYVTMTTTYTTAEGMVRVSELHVSLPLSLFCQPWLPAKAATHKITLDTNHPAVSLHTLFPELLPPQLERGPPNAMGFKLLAGPELTIVASKSSERYRLQTESFPAIGLFLEELVSRLEHHHISMKPAFRASYTSSLPLNEYFELLDYHFMLRSNLDQCREVMRRQSLQFRAVQKRLLTRFKDKTPTGLAHLDTLLDGTYRQLMSLTEKSEALFLELQECGLKLSCATQLITTLIRLSVQMSSTEYSILTATLTPLVQNSDTEQGWEEVVDATVTHLLKTTLAKSGKDQSVSLSIHDAPVDSQRLKRHIALFCDRILKGGSLSGQSHQESNEEIITGATRSLDTPGSSKAAQKKPEVLSGLHVNHPQKYRKHTLPALTEDAMETQTEL